MQGMESFPVEGTYKSLEFTHSESTVLNNGFLFHLNNTVGVIFVAEKIDPTTGCRDADGLTLEFGERGVLIYNCEKIRVPKQDGVAIIPGEAIYWDGVHANGVTNVWTSGLLWIGICVDENADADDDEVLIDLHGNHPLAEEAP